MDYAAAEAAYRQLESGDVRMRAIRAAITEADAEQDWHTALLLHHDLIRESVFSGDRYQALVDFPQYLAICEAHSDLDAQYAGMTLWLFKWLVELTTEFYQIEKLQALCWFQEFRKRLTMQGYSLNPFYSKRAMFYFPYDRAKFRLDYADFLASPLDGMSDGKTDFYHTQVRWELELDHYDKAMQAAEKIFQNQLRTEEIPASTYGCLLKYAMQQGDWTEAERYAKLLRPYCIGERFRLEQTGLLLYYDAQRNPEQGIAFWNRQATLREGSRNPHLCFWFDRGVAALLYAAIEQKIPVTDAKGNALTDAQVQQLQYHSMQSAQQLAAAFDKRNGSCFYAEQLPQF